MCVIRFGRQPARSRNESGSEFEGIAMELEEVRRIEQRMQPAEGPGDAEERTIRQSQLLGALYLLDDEQMNRATGEAPRPRHPFAQTLINSTLNVFRALSPTVRTRRPDKLDMGTGTGTGSTSASASGATSASGSAASSPGSRPASTAPVDLGQVMNIEDLQGLLLALPPSSVFLLPSRCSSLTYSLKNITYLFIIRFVCIA